jgi:hypothetical protein
LIYHLSSIIISQLSISSFFLSLSSILFFHLSFSLIYLIFHLYLSFISLSYLSPIHPSPILHRDGRQNTVMRRHCAPEGEAQPPHDGILPACRCDFGQNWGWDKSESGTGRKQG